MTHPRSFPDPKVRRPKSIPKFLSLIRQPDSKPHSAEKGSKSRSGILGKKNLNGRKLIRVGVRIIKWHETKAVRPQWPFDFCQCSFPFAVPKTSRLYSRPSGNAIMDKCITRLLWDYKALLRIILLAFLTLCFPRPCREEARGEKVREKK